MNRNIITEGIILKTNRIGEIHKGVTFLSPTLGIVNGIAHGAWKMKSKLRSVTQTFGYIKAYLYFDPVKDSYKISDVENLLQFFAISKSVEKYFIASLFIEIIIKSFGGGESDGGIFTLLLESLKLLDTPREDLDVFIIIQFIYRYLIFTGFTPQLSSCNRCGTIFGEKTTVLFDNQRMDFLCISCGRPDDVVIHPGYRMYLDKTIGLPFDKALEIKIDKEGAQTVKKILYILIESLLGFPLKSLTSGDGIL